MKDIAKYTGLGLATISSYFNGGNVREANRIKIEAAIKDLHYEINEVARGLKTNTTKTIGIVIPELNNIFFAEVISSTEDILRNHGYAAIVCDCRTDRELEKRSIDFLLKKRVDGIINIPVNQEGEHLKPVKDSGKPIVLIDRKIPEMDCDCVQVDNQKAAETAVEHLIQMGHRKIGIITGPDDVFTSAGRLKGYCQALVNAGIPVEDSLICHGEYNLQGGLNAIRKLLQDNKDMTAVFCANYDMTLGALISMNEMEISIPDQVSVVGFDHRDFSRAFQPKLTIVYQPTQRIGEEAARIILKRLGIPDDQLDWDEERIRGYDFSGPVEPLFQTELLIGKSVKRLK